MTSLKTKNWKILAVFPELISMGGAERSLAYLAKYFGMDIITNKYIPKKTFEEFKKLKIIELGQKNKFLFGLKLALTKFRGYDFFYDHGYFVTNFIALRNHPVVWYCHTPKRDLYPPLRSHYLGEIKNPIKKIFKLISIFFTTPIDKFLVSRIDVITCNSKNIQRRINKNYKRRSHVLFGPVDVESFRNKKNKGYYLCPGRIDPIKRTDLVVEAFQSLSEKKLIVAGSVKEGKKDQEYLKKLKEMAGNNVEFFLNVDDKKLRDLYSECIAVICMPRMEDFGLVPVEAMAAGKPCIGVNEGGLKETIIHNKTGVLIEPSVEELVKAVKHLTPEKSENMKEACFERSKNFSKEKFIERMEEVFNRIL